MAAAQLVCTSATNRSNRLPNKEVITYMKKMLLLSLLGLTSCQDPTCEKNADQTAGLVLRVLDRRYFAYDTKQGEDLSRNGIKISSTEQYKQVFVDCCANRLDSVDFSQYDILGLTTVNQGSNSSYIMNVTRDDRKKKVIYSVSENYCRRSSPIDGRSNFVVVPKLPAGYWVEYVRNQ